MMTQRHAYMGLLVAGLLGCPTLASAKESAPQTAAELRLRKLGRGAANIVTCPGELIRMPQLVARHSGQLAGLSVGLLQGAWRTVVRGAAGIVEVATFCCPVPRKDFSPLIEPEFVYAHGDWVQTE